MSPTYYNHRFPGIQKPLDQYGGKSAPAPAADDDDEDDDDDFDLFGDDDEVSLLIYTAYSTIFISSRRQQLKLKNLNRNALLHIMLKRAKVLQHNYFCHSLCVSLFTL